MFVHSGASLHGHEYSNPTGPNTARRRLPLLRSALRQTDPGTRTPSPSPAMGPARHSSYMETPRSPSQNAARVRPTSDIFSTRDHYVRFVEPMTDSVVSTDGQDLDFDMQRTPSESTHSEDDGMVSDASDSGLSMLSPAKRRRKRTPRKGTKFVIAQPPPRVVKRHQRFIQIRPKLILQLQQLTETRPKPAFDVLPPSALVGPAISAPVLAKKCPWLFRFRGGLGPADLVLVRSEDYDSPAAGGSDDDRSGYFDGRELLAVISPTSVSGDAGTEIALADGSVWQACLLPNGSYEFVRHAIDGRTAVARWVKRRTPADGDAENQYKYTFSVLDPSSRRHPILATLTPSTLDVLDTYTTVSPSSSGRYPPTRPFSYDGTTGHYHAAPSAVRTEERTTLPVDDATRALITITSVWVTLNLQPTTLVAPLPATAKPFEATAARSPSISQRCYSTIVPDRATASPAPSESSAIPSNSQIGDPSTTPSLVSENCVPATVPRRATSTGAAFMQRRRSRAVAADVASPEKKQDGEKKGFYNTLRKAFGIDRMTGSRRK